MKRIIIALLVISALAISEESLARSSNIFNLNGKNIPVPDNVLSQLREHWKGETSMIVPNKMLNEADIRWSLDYISILELINNKECKSLELLQTRNFDPVSDTDNSGAQITSGLFDYVWEIKACDIQRQYRVVHPKGIPSFAIYPINL
ncbi:hypothetical protein LP316_10145 [Thalassotalea sp. LPB0316]|uniref:hypothetical protein n=1 Tax=Thalassotalea sp. LPB0316 TaxID=2769490 RepID=UPI001867E84B|nr:hypothetical protein [Thalassotalea sp. LPB0316]QOL24697.1 hypothetical protein LP316_10145 [Thalassotalea sp. LPB0316]